MANVELSAAIALTIGIGLQNFPEGIAVAMPLQGEGISRFKSFWYGQLSAVVEPCAAVLGAASDAAGTPRPAVILSDIFVFPIQCRKDAPRYGPRVLPTGPAVRLISVQCTSPKFARHQPVSDFGAPGDWEGGGPGSSPGAEGDGASPSGVAANAVGSAASGSEPSAGAPSRGGS